MDTKIEVSDEEIQEETEAQAEVKEDEVRAKVITDLGIEDNDANKDIIEKATKREVAHHTKLSKAIGQKISLREKLNEGKPDDKKTPSKKTDEETQSPADAAKLVEEKFMQRDLDEMDHSDKVKDEIKKIAERQDISIRKAEKDPYIQNMIEGETRQKKVDDAAKNGSGKERTGVTVDTSTTLNPADYDMSTEEGRKEWKDAKAAMQDARNT